MSDLDPGEAPDGNRALLVSYDIKSAGLVRRYERRDDSQLTFQTRASNDADG